MAVAEELQIIVDAKTAGAVRDLKKVTGTTTKLTDTLKKLAGPVAIGAVVAATIQMGKASVKAFGVQEQAEAKLRQTIISTGEAAGLTEDQLLGMATGLQEVTKFGDEAIIGAESLLLTFKNVGEDVFPRALESILDVSEAMGQGLKESTVQLGKALNDPIQGLTALRRVGIQFSDSQEETIKSMVKMNDIAGAQNIILEEMESQFGGVARAAAATATGSLTQLSNVTGDLQESFGRSIAEGINPFVSGLTKVITEMVKARNEAYDLKEALNIVDEGGITTAKQTALILQDQVDKLGAIASSYEGLDEKANKAWENAKTNLIAYNEALTMGADSFVIAEQAKQEALKQTAITEGQNKKLSVEAFEEIAQLQFDAMSADEKEILSLQEKINYWAELKDSVVGAEELFQELAARRNELQKEEIVTMQDLFEGKTTIAEEWRDAELTRITEIAAAEQAAADESIRIAQLVHDAKLTLMSETFGLAQTLLTADTAANKKHAKKNWQISQALSISESIINTALAVTKALTVDPTGILATIVGITGGVQVAAIVAQPAPAFATGTSGFTTNGPQMIQVGDNASGREKVTVTPESGGSGGSERVYASVDGGEGFWMTIQRGIDDRKVRYPERNLV